MEACGARRRNMKRIRTLLFHDVFETHPGESGFTIPGADRYKLPVDAFEAQLRDLDGVLTQPPVLVTAQTEPLPDAIPVAITVDDGGRSYYGLVSERLEQRGWRGHCFVTTGQIGRRGFLDKHQLRDLHCRGHSIGTHSVSHPARFALCSGKQMLREWRDSRKALQDILGADVVTGSVPGGYFSPAVAHTASAAGLTTLFTSEPECRVRQIGRCAIVGRFTVRRGSKPGYAAEVAAGRPLVLYSEWLAWNAKKPVKALLGGVYPQLSGWLSGNGGQPMRD
jgi:peptidoglycan/xylan/chitin deacetylase (PgdA/CDA1 family)